MTTKTELVTIIKPSAVGLIVTKGKLKRSTPNFERFYFDFETETAYFFRYPVPKRKVKNYYDACRDIFNAKRL